MLSTRARVETSRPSRYLVQLCRHASAIGRRRGHAGPTGHTRHGPGAAAIGQDVEVRAEWTDSHGTLTFHPWGRCSLTAEASTLRVQVYAATVADVERIQDVVTRNLERFSRRDPLMVVWDDPRPCEGSLDADDPSRSPAGSATPTASPHRGHRRVPLIAVIGALGGLALAAHLGLFGVTLAGAAWLGITIEVAAVLILIKLALLTTGILRLHRRRRPASWRDRPTSTLPPPGPPSSDS